MNGSTVKWKYSRENCDLGRVNSPFREDFISQNFAYAKFHENKTLAKISEFTVFDLVILK